MEIIIVVYIAGCLTTAFLVDMISECYKANYPDAETDSSAACIFSMGSWLAAWYLYKFNKKEIEWTWKKWRKKL